MQTFSTDVEAVQYLTADGILDVPCSRYGRDSMDCAMVAWVLALIYAEHSSGGPITADNLDSCMSLVVNDHQDVEDLLSDLAETVGWLWDGELSPLDI